MAKGKRFVQAPHEPTGIPKGVSPYTRAQKDRRRKAAPIQKDLMRRNR
jgi:hypothetical protein